MDLRKNIFSGLLLAIGFVMHQIIPGAAGGMKFDIQLAMLLIIIAINMNFKNTLITSIASGILTALTTTFPGGQLPNMIDKIVTSIFVYFLLKLLTKFFSRQLSIAAIGLIGTLISGTVFLYSALLITGLPAPFTALFIGVVIPTAITNIILTLLLYNILHLSLRAVNANI